MYFKSKENFTENDKKTVREITKEVSDNLNHTIWINNDRSFGFKDGKPTGRIYKMVIQMSYGFIPTGDFQIIKETLAKALAKRGVKILKDNETQRIYSYRGPDSYSDYWYFEEEVSPRVDRTITLYAEGGGGTYSVIKEERGVYYLMNKNHKKIKRLRKI
jgi:hypothetical protein